MILGHTVRMRLTNYRRLVAVASLLLTSSSLVQGAHAERRPAAAASQPPVLSLSEAIPTLRARANATTHAPPSSTGRPSAVTGPQAQTAAGAPPGGQGPPPGTAIDPADAGFPGGSPPNASVDLPLTIAFLAMYVSGAATHISIYQANAKRGHKFLLSDLMFDFCMVRSLTCIFRIVWIFSQLRGIILAAQIFFNGG